MAIGRGLSANCSLQALDISWNGLADEGAAAFGESLKENNTLIDLDLTNNRISTEGALAFAKGLQINNTLKILRFVSKRYNSYIKKRNRMLALFQHFVSSSLKFVDTRLST